MASTFVPAFLLHRSHCTPSTRCSAASSTYRLPMSRTVRIAVVGDVHDDWDLRDDSKALQFLQPDLVLFTGDFGNENVDLVRSIAELKFLKAAILGNHDSWKTQQLSTKRKDGVQQQLEWLDFPTLKLSVVGGRPFSCGGDCLFRKLILSARYGVLNMDESANKIYQSAAAAPEEHLIILLAHNGPSGLGSSASDICGRDWVAGGGDHGDPDLAKAIARIKEDAKLSIPLVVFGHMHKQLAHRQGLRKMIVHYDNTIYLNGAIVPRSQKLPGESETDQATKRAFTVVDIVDGTVDAISETWVSVSGDSCMLQDQQVLFQRSPSFCPSM
uniref:Calcineurin-like phosphoesterase domain-containing protein n=1 Tax=Kalanchoe fedtschenkoi TaxID=63787 RepID=A0A7N0TBK9_KALFE